MGFCGLDHWTEVDGAADVRFGIEKSVEKLFKKELENEGNSYNPPGLVNILLIVKDTPEILSFLSEDFVDHLFDKVTSFNYMEWRKDLRPALKKMVNIFLKAAKKY